MSDTGLPDVAAEVTTDSSVSAVSSETAQPVQQSQPVVQESSETPGINPAWNDLLGAMPSSLHSQIIPHLQKWDQGVQQRFATVQSQFEPYKAFVDNGLNPKEIEAALAMTHMIASDPRAFYDRMTERFGAEWGIGQGQAPSDADEYSFEDIDEETPTVDLENNPLVKQLQDQQNIIAQFLTAQMQQQQQAEQAKLNEQADKDLQSSIATVTEKYGNGKPLPEAHVKAILSYALQNDNVSVEDAADVIYGSFGASQQPRPPVVVNPSGGVPMVNTNPADLDRSQTKDLVMQLLRANSSNS